MPEKIIPFNKPYMTGKELYYIANAHFSLRLAGDGKFTKQCNAWLENNTGCAKSLLAHSCTAALEMSAVLLDIAPGDEIIMPSYTFVSTANAFVSRGGVPVFVDVREDTLNIDEKLIEQAITPRTRAIAPVHYAGVGCEMDRIMEIANAHGLDVVEDAAQGIMARYKGRPLGSFGRFGTFSFHETKNIISGEGGALLVNRPEDVERAEIIRDKGTNRKKFFEGNVDKYTWVDTGSSFLPGEIIAAFLWAQLEEAQKIQKKRCALWHNYHDELKRLENAGYLRRPIIPGECEHNAHLYHIRLDPRFARDRVIARLKEEGIHAVFHYIPLHSSPGGQKFGRAASAMPVTDSASASLLRLPLYNDMTGEEQAFVLEKLESALKELA